MKMLSGAIVILAGSIAFSTGVVVEAMRYGKGEAAMVAGFILFVVGAGPFLEPWWASVKQLYRSINNETRPPQLIRAQKNIAEGRPVDKTE